VSDAEYSFDQAVAALRAGDAPGGRRLLAAAAGAGHPFAGRLLVTAALGEDGLGGARDALVRLDEAAGARARTQIAVLRAELECFHAPAPASAPPRWAELLARAAIEEAPAAAHVVALYAAWSPPARQPPSADVDALAAWLAQAHDGWRPPAGETLSGDSEVAVTRRAAFAPEVLLALVRRVLTPRLQRSLVVDPRTGARDVHPVRDNAAAQWLPDLLGWPGKLLEHRLALAGGYRVEQGEVGNLLYYAAGQQYRPHLDCLPARVVESDEGRAGGGQRVSTLLLALAPPPVRGGETDFPALGLRVSLAAGDLLMFRNADGRGQPLVASRHAGLPVGGGEKWLLSKWVRERATPYGASLARTF
jgi:hypothetical protein